MAKIISHNEKGYCIAEYTINWKEHIEPILRRRYVDKKNSYFLNKIVSNQVMSPAFKSTDILKIEDDNNDKKVFQLTKTGWELRGDYNNFLIKEEDLIFLNGIVEAKVATAVKNKIMQVQNDALKSLDYKVVSMIDETGTSISSNFGIVKAIKLVLSRLYNSEVVDEVAAEVLSALFDVSTKDGVLICLWDNGKNLVVYDMQKKLEFKNINSLREYISNLEPDINPDEFCKAIVTECFEIPKTLKDGYYYRTVKGISLKASASSYRWQLEKVETLKIAKPEIAEFLRNYNCYRNNNQITLSSFGGLTFTIQEGRDVDRKIFYRILYNGKIFAIAQWKSSSYDQNRSIDDLGLSLDVDFNCFEFVDFEF